MKILKKLVTSRTFWSKSYNGVAIISKIKISNIRKDFIEDDLKQSRIISGEILIKIKINLINIYVPNGNPIQTDKYEYKKLVEKIIKNIKKELIKNSHILIAYDFNIIPEEIDVYDLKGMKMMLLGN